MRKVTASELVSLLTYLFSKVLDGHNARLAHRVQHALGREPMDFTDCARDTTATGVWNGVPLGTSGSLK